MNRKKKIIILLSVAGVLLVAFLLYTDTIRMIEQYY